MDFGFSAEQGMLREQVQRFVARDAPMPLVRAIAAGDTAAGRKLWTECGGLGIPTLLVPEEHDGLGLGWVDALVVIEEMGRGLSPLPVVSHLLCIAAVLIAGSDAQKRDWLTQLAAGEQVWTIALYDEPNWIGPDAVTLSGVPDGDGFVLTGAKPFVMHGALADHLLLAFRTGDGIALARIAREAVTVTPQPVMDTTKPSASVTLDGCRVAAADVLRLDAGALERLTDLGALAVTIEGVGAMEAALAMTAGYTRERVQFGKPIGQYQGVKHRLADMFVDIESVKSLAQFAAWAADHAPSELPRAVSLAKGYAADAFARIGIDCVGLHGAIGYTDEYDVQLYLKRAKWMRPMFGDSDFHLERAAALGGM